VDIDDKEPPSLDFSDIEQKYRARHPQSGGVSFDEVERTPYYVDPERRLLVLLVKPAQLASDFSYSKRVVDDVRKVVQQVDLTAFDEGMTVALSGRYKKKIDQKKAIEGDLAKSSIVALLGVLIYVAFYFRRLFAVVLIMTPLFIGLVWTFGFAGYAFGELNILTSFVGAILLGLGIDHGVHLLSRYQEERKQKVDVEAAVVVSFSSTGHAVVLAALTTMIGFAGLSVSEFKAFREFGMITAIGTIFVVAAYVLLLPALLNLGDRWMPQGRTQDAATGPMDVYARGLSRWAPAVFWLASVGLFALASYAPYFPFNYDFAALEGTEIPSFKLDKIVNEVLGRSQTPIVVLTDDEADETKVVSELRARSKARDEATGIDYVLSKADLIPAEQDEKYEILEELSKTLSRIDPETVGKEGKRLQMLTEMAGAEPFTLKDLPKELTRQFEAPKDRAHAQGGVVLVFPSVSLSDGRKVIDLAREVRGIPLADGKKVSASSEALVTADVLSMIFRESPIVVALTLLLVFVSLWLFLGSLSMASLTFAPALITTTCTLGATALLGLKLNYLNIVMIPVLFGIAVDEGVHLVIRRSNYSTDLTRILPETGNAIIGATLTTAIGFSALLLAHHPGLNSFGRLALLGLFINLGAALVWLAALLGLAEIRKRRLAAVDLWSSPTARWSGDVSSVGGAGYSPLGPGTFGAIAALPVGWLLSFLSLGLNAAIVTVLTLLSIVAAHRYMQGDSKESDPSEIVSDEFVGMLITLVFVPWTPVWVLAAFVLFRAFDILKPGPVGYVDRNMKNATGVILDDVAAGLLAGGLLAAVRIGLATLEA
ncbi:MAG: phosphatidylglycerophosphatase A, partial [Myxococcota bacterium]